jgi:hypothetical protein
MRRYIWLILAAVAVTLTGCAKKQQFGDKPEDWKKTEPPLNTSGLLLLRQAVSRCKVRRTLLPAVLNNLLPRRRQPIREIGEGANGLNQCPEAMQVVIPSIGACGTGRRRCRRAGNRVAQVRQHGNLSILWQGKGISPRVAERHIAFRSIVTSVDEKRRPSGAEVLQRASPGASLAHVAGDNERKLGKRVDNLVASP